MPWPRAILHVDMDAFFAAIVQRDQPELRGKPVLVGGSGPRAVVTTASYEARPFGCGSAMPMAVARRRCPQAVVVPVPSEAIRHDSRRVFEMLHEVTDLVQPVSVDEAFVDVTGRQRELGEPEAIAQLIRDRIRAELGLTASVGVAFNKFLAKLASDMDKPDGLTVISPGNVDEVLPPLGIGRLWGVGPASQRKLEAMGLKTFGDLRSSTPEQLEKRLGSWGRKLYELAHGRDDRPVTQDRQAKSVGHECTFGHDVDDADEVRAVLLSHCEQVGVRLRRAGLKARAVSIKVRYGDFETISRSATLREATDTTQTLWQAVRGLYDDWVRSGFRAVRLIGCAAERLDDGPTQMALFGSEEREKQAKLDGAVDAIVAKFGKGAVHRGVSRRDRKRDQGDTGQRWDRS